jgi:methionine sulfoxide reductase heme-binding subunit
VGPTLRPGTRLVTITVHRAAALMGAGLVLLHVVLAVTDRFVVVPLVSVVVPLASGWERQGIGLAAVAVDLMLAVVITALLRVRMGPSWRRVHLLAYPTWGLVVGHALLVGTDAQLVRWESLGALVAVLIGLSMRLLRSPGSPAARAADPRRTLSGVPR